ncbi:MAG: hypothetical protein II931_07410 [Clostridia bacterium]|nr:hypothetical protein [Clostridia bacterium]
MIQCSMFLHKMADYTPRYSGADIDSICDKVTDMRFTAAEISNFFEKKISCEWCGESTYLKEKSKPG